MQIPETTAVLQERPTCAAAVLQEETEAVQNLEKSDLPHFGPGAHSNIPCITDLLWRILQARIGHMIGLGKRLSECLKLPKNEC